MPPSPMRRTTRYFPPIRSPSRGRMRSRAPYLTWVGLARSPSSFELRRHGFVPCPTALEWGNPESMIRSAILGSGHYHPTRVVTNDDLAKMFQTTDEWIQQRSGIKERRFIEHTGIGASDLALPAVKMALEQA